MNSDYLDINYLKTLGTPYYFGLGFIQLKFQDGKSRLHFYHPEILPIIDDEEIHNHRYSFESKILKGFIDNEIYTYKSFGSIFYPNIKHSLVEVSCKKEDAGKEPKWIQDVEPVKLAWFSTIAGNHYTLTPSAFHKIKIYEPTITLLQRGEIVSDTAQVIRDNTKPAVCPFSKKIETEECWEIINDILEK